MQNLCRVFLILLVLSVWPLNVYAIENKISLTVSGDTKVDEQKVEEITLVSHDLLIASALKAEKMAFYPLFEKKDNLEKEIIETAFKALTRRWQSWKLAKDEFTEIFIGMQLDFASMQRFFEPDKEYFLTFEKSVHTRVNYFYRLLASGQLDDKTAFFNLSDKAGPLDYAKLYHRVYAFDPSTTKGQISIMLWLHLLRTEPALQILWQKYQKLTKLIYPENVNLWEQIEKAAVGISLARMQDLQDSLNRVRIFNTLKENDQIYGNKITVFNEIDEQVAELVKILDRGEILLNAENLLDVTSKEPERKLRIKAAMKSRDKYVELETFLGKINLNEATDFDLFLLSENLRKDSFADNRNIALWVMNGNRVPVPEIRPMIHLFFKENARVELAKDYYAEYARRYGRLANRFNSEEKEYVELATTFRKWSEIFLELSKLEPEQTECTLKFAGLPASLKNNQNLLFTQFGKPEFIRVLSAVPDMEGKPARLYLGKMQWLSQTIETEITKTDTNLIEIKEPKEEIPLVAIEIESTEEKEPEKQKVSFKVLRLIYNEGIAEFSLDSKNMLENSEYFAPSSIERPKKLMNVE